MQNGYIHFGGRRLHYLRHGSGKDILLAFHGYGNEAGLFRSLAVLLEERYTFVSIDLPHHGGSAWDDDLPFTKEDLALLTEQVLREFDASCLTLAGYSLGGRVCLNVAELLPGKVQRMLLIAPDGLTLSPFYFFVTRTFIGKKMFRSFLSRKEERSRLIDWLYQRSILDPSRYRFLRHYLGTASSRSFILKVWPAMRFLLPDIKKVKRRIRDHNIRVNIFMGRHDRVIPVHLAESFGKGLDNVQLHILDKGHRLFDQDSLSKMAGCLL